MRNESYLVQFLLKEDGSVAASVTFSPRFLSVVVDRSTDGMNWTVTIESTSALSTDIVELTIRTSTGTAALAPAPISTYLTETVGIWYDPAGIGVALGRGDEILVDMATYPAGFTFELADAKGVLVFVELR